jgi:hypothetical protein
LLAGHHDALLIYLGEAEVGHTHLDSEAHVFLPRIVANASIKALLGRHLEWNRNVVAFAIERLANVEHAVWLFQLSYDRRRGATGRELVSRVEARAARSAGMARSKRVRSTG